MHRPIKIGDELAEIFRILKIGVLRYDVKLEPYHIQRGISTEFSMFQGVG